MKYLFRNISDWLKDFAEENAAILVLIMLVITLFCVASAIISHLHANDLQNLVERRLSERREEIHQSEQKRLKEEREFNEFRREMKRIGVYFEQRERNQDIIDDDYWLEEPR